MKALIVAGEASGDLYGGRLAAELKSRFPALAIAGMGGPQMGGAGVHLLYDYGSVAVVGVLEVVSKLRHLKAAYSRIKGWIKSENPDFAILIDFPDFNFRLARFLKRQNIPVFYFISPQLWAWRKNRIHFLKQYIDLMISILPFEKKLYEDAGVPVIYVGHPLVEMVQEELTRTPVYARGTRTLLGLMPGSRGVEIERHLPILLDTFRRIRQILDVEGLLIQAPGQDFRAYPIPSEIRVESVNRYAAMKASDLVLVASGTSTLECAILRTPLFIVYRVGTFSWQLGKVLVDVPYYGLVNWLAGRQVIPEYIQGRMDPSLLATDAVSFLNDPSRVEQMKSDLTNIVEGLGPPGAIGRAVDAISERMNS